MKTKIRAFWILLAIALALSLALGALLYTPSVPQKTAAPAETLHTITQIPLPSLAAVQIRNPLSSFALLQTPGAIEVIAKETAHYDQTQLRTLLYAVCNLTSNRKVTEKENFSRYGMDEPEGEIVLRLTDASSLRLLLLAKDPLSDNRYLYSEQDDAIYLLPAQVAALFFRSEKDFVSHTVFPLRGEEDFSGIERIEVSLAGGQKKYAIEPSASGYLLVEPVRHRLPAANVRQKLLDNAVRLYADRVLATEADFAEYGLDMPFLTLSMQINGSSYEAFFAEHPELGCLMGNPQEKTVYQLEDDTAYLLMQSYTDLMNGQVLAYALGDLLSIRLSAEGLPDVLLSLINSSAGLSIQRNETPLSKEAQSNIITALNSLPIIGELEGEISGQSAYRLVIQFQNGSTDLLDFLAIGDGLCALRINGQTHFVTAMEAVQTLLSALMP